MNGTMKAVIFEQPGQYAVVDKPIPKIRQSNEMLVRIDVCSICGTDMQILKNPPGIAAAPGVTIGHEMVGTVVEVGDGVKNFKAGDRVTADNNVPCGTCYYCKTGHGNMCENLFCLGIDGDGFFAQYAVIPDQLAVTIDPDLSLDTAIFTEPLNCVMSGMDKIRLLPGETAVVIGAGPIGLYYIQLLKLNGAGKVIAVELNDFRKEYARKLGADLVISPSESGQILEATKGLGADVVIDAVGACIKDAVDWVRSSGRVLLFGLNFAAQQTICQTNITRKDLTVMGCYIGTYTWKKTVQLLENVPMKLEEMITHRLSLEEFGKGYEAMKDGSALEVVMYPNGR